MDPKILDFLYLNGFVVLLLVLYIAFWRPKRQPTVLKFRKDNKTVVPAVNQPRAERQLNVIFQFNGHDFEAYEVFGLPPGSSRDAVEAAFNEVIERSDKDSHEFYRHAVEAIRRS